MDETYTAFTFIIFTTDLFQPLNFKLSRILCGSLVFRMLNKPICTLQHVDLTH